MHLQKCRNSKIEEIDSLLSSESKYFICRGFCLSWNSVWLTSRVGGSHCREMTAGLQGAGSAAPSGAGAGSAPLAASSAAQQSCSSGFVSVRAGWHALLQALGSELGWGGGKDSQGRWLAAASRGPGPAARLGAEPACFTSGHPTLLTRVAPSCGAPAPCAWNSPLLREALGGDPGELHGLLVPGKGS